MDNIKDWEFHATEIEELEYILGRKKEERALSHRVGRAGDYLCNIMTHNFVRDML